MNEFMIVVRFNSIFSEEFVSLVPEHRKVVNELMEKGIITSNSLSAGRSTQWITILASSHEAVEKTLQLMPLYKFMLYEVVELMFHRSPVYSPMRFSMN